MADEVKEAPGNVDTSMAGLLDKLVKSPQLEYLDHLDDKPKEEETKDDSVEPATPEEPEKVEEEVVEAPKEEEPKRDKVQERIDKLTAQKKAAEEEALALKSKVDELSKGPQKEFIPVPTKENPLSDIVDLNGLKSKEDQVEQLRDLCLRNPDGVTIDGVFYEPKDVREALVATDKILRKDIPARKEYLATHASVTEQAKIDFPEIFDARTSEYQMAQNVLRNFPEIRKFPAYMQFIGYLIAGEKVTVDKRDKGKKANSIAKPIEKVPTPPTASTGTTKNNTTPTIPSKPRIGSKADAVNYIMDTVLKNSKF